MNEQMLVRLRCKSTILSGKASTGPITLVKDRLVPSMVIIRGAVSPANLEIASTTPVSTPFFAVGSMTKRAIFHLGMPREYASSLMWFGTILRVSSGNPNNYGYHNNGQCKRTCPNRE